MHVLNHLLIKIRLIQMVIIYNKLVKINLSMIQLKIKNRSKNNKKDQITHKESLKNPSIHTKMEDQVPLLG